MDDTLPLPHGTDVITRVGRRVEDEEIAIGTVGRVIERHALAAELGVQPFEVRQWLIALPTGRWVQPGLRQGVVHFVRQRPTETGDHRPADAVTDRARRDPNTSAHVAKGHAEAEPQQLVTLMHKLIDRNIKFIFTAAPKRFEGRAITLEREHVFHLHVRLLENALP